MHFLRIIKFKIKNFKYYLLQKFKKEKLNKIKQKT